MLTVNDLININEIPEESDISLDLLVDFYEQHLNKFEYQFTLDNDEIIKLRFRDASEIYHLVGIRHIYEKAGIQMSGDKFVDKVKINNLTFNDLQNINPKEYKRFNLRMRSFVCVNSLLKRCDCLFFPDGKIPGSEIGAKYLLLRHFNDVNLHLGINTYKEDRPFFAKTLLPTDGAVKEKYIERAKEKFSIKKLEIIELKTERIIETIDREKAIQTAKSDIWKLAENWISKKVSEAQKEGVLESLKGRDLKKELETHLRSNKNTLETNVMNHDAYLTGKIVMNAIHGYIKNDFQERLLAYIDKFKKLDQEKDAEEEPTPKPEPKERPEISLSSMKHDKKEMIAREAAQSPVKPVGISKPKRDGIDD